MNDGDQKNGLLDKIILYCLRNQLVVVLLLVLVVVTGLSFAPFDWSIRWLPRNPVPVDAIPDIGENQQVVFSSWPGRSPQDVEDQITDPLTASLLGIPEVRSVRGLSMFGFSTIYVIFKDNVEFYWSRSRILEKLNSLASGTLPDNVKPSLGPDATALGQIFWYTLEGRDQDGNPTGGWNLDELRSVQDWFVRYKLMAAEGVSEVASVGGFVREYQIDVNPGAMRAYHVRLDEVFKAVKAANADVGARSIEVNQAEYLVRGIGFVTKLEDLENTVIKVHDNVPIYVKNVANVSLGPALRRGALDRSGVEAVGGVVVVRFGANPLEAIKRIKTKIEEIEPGLPAKVIIDYRSVRRSDVEAFARERNFEAYDGNELNHEAWRKWLTSAAMRDKPAWLTLSKVRIIPFYDRTGLIHETLDTLNTALSEEILVTIIVVMVMVMHLRSSMLIAGLLPVAVLMCFVGMKLFGQGEFDASQRAESVAWVTDLACVDVLLVAFESTATHRASVDNNSTHTLQRASVPITSAFLCPRPRKSLG